MKYIRTKTEIKAFITTLNSKELFDYLKQFDNYKNDLIMVDDTIEELCDEFIIKHNYNTVLPYEIVNSLKPIINGMKVYIDEFKKSDVYGAIWTDKGLIYVAKMNEKGELELL